jgi:hypothetical protein
LLYKTFKKIDALKEDIKQTTAQMRTIVSRGAQAADLIEKGVK